LGNFVSIREINSLRSDLGRLSESGDDLREKTIAQRLVIIEPGQRRASSQVVRFDFSG
jgi:hypothetical protein